MNNVEVDARQVINLFADLTSNEQRRSYRNALKRAANILAKETKKRFKGSLGRAATHRNWWNHKTLVSGVRSKANREGTEAKVHILGDFRLKFFEMGTRIRRTTGNNNSVVRGVDPAYRQRRAANRGKITGYHFFRQAKAAKEQEVFSSIDNLISQSIQRIAERNRR